MPNSPLKKWFPGDLGATAGLSSSDSRENLHSTAGQASSGTLFERAAKPPTLFLLALAVELFAAPDVRATEGDGDKRAPMVREIFVPFEELDVLLEDQPERVLLSRQQYEELLVKAKVVPESRAPLEAALLSADYVATAETDRARVTGTLGIEVLENGLHALSLDLSGVGLRRAALDGKAAAIGRAENGSLTLFVEGQGRHELVLDMVAPLETTAATQVLKVRLARPPTATLKLTVPGDVEIKSGADVAARTVDAAAGVTRFELLPRKGDMAVLMTLNSHLLRRQRAVVARSVVVDEVTEAYERLHATVSMKVLHQAVSGFRFALPEGFEVTKVDSPLLASWAVEENADARVLDVRLRDQSSETVVLNLSAVRTTRPPDGWTFPKLEPLDVLGQVAVLGLLVDRRLEAESIAAAGLIPIDASVLHQAIPKSVFEAEPGAPTLRSVVAYYAPQSQFELSARFTRPPAEIAVMTNVLLLLGEQRQEVKGEFFLTPAVEKLFGFDFSAPPAWHVTGVTTPEGNPLAFERYGPKGGPGRIHVRFPQGVSPGEEFRVYFNARSVPPDWLGKWESKEVEFPRFAALQAVEDLGAIAVEAPDGEMEVRLLAHENLMPLDAAERKQYGLEESETTGSVLAYRYETQPYQATLLVRRTEPRLTAKTFSFLRVDSDALSAHYEVVYQVDEARARKLTLLLPEETPADLSLVALDGVRLKQFTSEVAGGSRRWTALLEEPRKGEIRLAVDFREPFPGQGKSTAEQELEGFVLPIIRASGVAYQSGLVAVEGSPELEVQVSTEARRVDVGELSESRRRPGRGLLGVFGFIDQPPDVKVDVFRRPAYRLHPTIAERAELTTRLSAAGESVTVARFNLRTKAVYLEVELPPGADLWAADLDSEPIKPQREGDHLLVSLPAASGDAPLALRMVYRMPVDAVGLTGRLKIPAPKLRLRAAGETEGVEVPLADLVWRLHPPPGYEVVRSDGTLVAQIEPPEPAIITVGRAACGLALWRPPFQVVREAARGPTAASPYYMNDDVQYFEPSTRDLSLLEDMNGQGFRADSGIQIAATEEPATPKEAAESKEEYEDIAAEEMPKDDADQPVSLFGRAVDESARKEQAGAELSNMRPEGAPGSDVLRPEVAGEELRRQVHAGQAQAGERSLTAAVGGIAIPEAPAQGQPPPQTPPELVGKAGGSLERLQGRRSLKINLEEAPNGDGAVTFQSLGVEPQLSVTLAHRPRFDAVAWGVALAVALLGLALTNRSARTKFRYILAVILLGTFVAMAPGWEAVAGPANLAVFFVCLLVPYYLAAGCLKWLAELFRRRSTGFQPVTKQHRQDACATGVVILAIAIASCPAPLADAAEPQAKSVPYVVQVVEPPEPVKVPDDAILLPYDPDSETGIQDAEQLLVPYAKYVELWNLAYPDQKLQAEKPPARYGLAGASYTTRLEGNEYLSLDGQIDINLYVEEETTVPLGLAGGVLTRALMDGKPARLSVPQVAAANPAQQPAAQQAKQQAANPAVEAARPMVLLHLSGKGRHRLEFSVRLCLERRGGWRVAEGMLPSAPAASLSITVPEAGTDVRLGHVVDRQVYETEKADQRVETALGPEGAVSLQWRPKVAEGQVDRSLAARSSAVFDVEEDGLRLVWQLTLQFRRGQRDVFSVRVPGDYFVERVEGTNVRGWEVRREEPHQTIEVSLLKAARDSETFAVHLWRAGAVGQNALSQFDAPLVTVPDAALHTGRLVVRRSPLLDLRTLEKAGVARTDLPVEDGESGGAAGDDSPLGIRPYEAYTFAAVPFSLRLEASPLEGRMTAEVETVLKIAEFKRSLESQVNLEVRDRPVYRVEMFLPERLDLEEVSAPGDFQWAVTRAVRGSPDPARVGEVRRPAPSEDDDRPLLTVYLATGQQGRVPLRIAGTLARAPTRSRSGAADPVAIPRIEVLGVDRQQGQIAVQADPAFDVQPADLENCEKVLKSRLYGWINPRQREATRLAFSYQRPDYRGTLRLSAREPAVTCETVTNVRVTDRALEETLLLNFTIEQAGLRELEFLLPRWMAQSRIQVPMLRQKTIEPVDEKDESPLRVRLELQDDVMGQLRVLVENDRVLTAEAHSAPIPIVRTGRTLRQAVALQSAGRDEVVVDKSQLAGLEPIRRGQSGWEALEDVLGAVTEAYQVVAGAKTPRLVFKTQRRKALQTTGARIGLAETNLVLDPTGAYRASAIYRLDNTTEQFLVIELPGGARLWTALVAGRPAKPTEVPGATNARQVRIPLVKTAPGDLDYAVVLKYGGKLPEMGGKMPALGTLGGAQVPLRFPLVQTVNIKVQLSQVRLHLPETYRWFDFGGTMGLVGEEEELTAGFISYQTKQAERLVETMQHADLHAQERAASNFRQLGLALQNYENAHGAFPGYATYLGEEYTKNAAVLERGEQQLQQLEETAAEERTVDNRSRLNAYFDEQKTSRSRNVVQDLGRNWDAPVEGQVSQEAGKPVQFNERWFFSNSLSSPPADKKAAAAKRLPSRPSGKRRLEKGKQKAPANQERFRGDRFQEGKAATKRESAPAEGEKGPGPGRFLGGIGGGGFGHDRRQMDDERAARQSGRGVTIADKSVSTLTETLGDRAGGQIALADGQVALAELPALVGGEAGVPAGLASLDVELPMRGVVYRFTTPGGDVKITARAVDGKLVANLVRAAAVLGTVFVVLFLLRLTRRGGFRWLTGRIVSWCLILLGTLSLCVLPVIGLVAIAAGIAIKARRVSPA